MYRELSDYPPYQAIWGPETTVGKRLKHLEARIFDPKTSPEERHVLVAERSGLLSFASLVELGVNEESTGGEKRSPINWSKAMPSALPRNFS